MGGTGGDVGQCGALVGLRPSRPIDEALGEVLSALQAEGLPYSAVLTALRPSRVSAAPQLPHSCPTAAP